MEGHFCPLTLFLSALTVTVEGWSSSLIGSHWDPNFTRETTLCVPWHPPHHRPSHASHFLGGVGWRGGSSFQITHDIFHRTKTNNPKIYTEPQILPNCQSSLFFKGCFVWPAGAWFSNQGSHVCPLSREHRTLTIGWWGSYCQTSPKGKEQSWRNHAPWLE